MFGQPAGSPLHANSAPAELAGPASRRLPQILDGVTLGFLFLFALVQPLSIAATHISYAGAALAWLIRLVVVRRRGLYSSPLDLPIFIYLVLSALSALQSPLPVSSWEGMRKVALICVVLVVAHNVTTLARARQLGNALLLSGLVTVAWTFWMYAGGVGLRVLDPGPDPAWFRAGLRKDDVILRVDGRRLTTPQQFLAHLRASAAPSLWRPNWPATFRAKSTA